jgi:small subunit ribosomal protein S12e
MNDTPAPVAEVAVQLDPETALKEVLKKALIYDGLTRGLRETVKALDRREALLCVLAQDCNEAAYVTLITALCLEHSIPLMKVSSAKQLVRTTLFH